MVFIFQEVYMKILADYCCQIVHAGFGKGFKEGIYSISRKVGVLYR